MASSPLVLACAVMSYQVQFGCTRSPGDGTASGGDESASFQTSSGSATSLISGSEASPTLDVTSSTVAYTTSSGEPSSSSIGEVSGTSVSTTSSLDEGGSCDLWQPDCPSGTKCMPWAPPGEPTWVGAKCTPLVDDPRLPGESCFVSMYFLSGIDNCDSGAMCWFLDEMGKGLCFSMCSGVPRAPTCPDVFQTCYVDGSGYYHLCTGCNPLSPVCPSGYFCAPSGEFEGEGFECAFGQPGSLMTGEPCQSYQDCSPGAFCDFFAKAPQCKDIPCCTEFCDVSNPQCVSPGDECIPYFADDPPAPLGEVGLCVH